MAHTRRPQHPNAALTPTQRLKMVRLVGDAGAWPRLAQRFQVDDKTTRKLGRPLDRRAGMGDRSSHPVSARGASPEGNDSR